jgi:ABC-type methionine transport system ATPase subunit
MAITMSGGEQQMLAIARATISSPRLIMLDEPSEGIMPVLVDEMFELFSAMKAEGTTILLVEQNVELALAIADHAYVLDQGTIVHHDTGKALLADAKHLIGTLLESGTVSLSGTQTKLLLLLGGTEGLPVALVHKTGNRLAGSQALLASQISLRDTTAITAKCTLRNLVPQKAGLFLTLLLAQVSHSRTDHAIQIRGHILIDLLPTQRTSINGLSTSSGEAGSHALIWLCASLCLIKSSCRSGIKRLRTS